MAGAPDPTPDARFRVDLETLTGPLGDRRLALAVSGGPDSMAMLALAAAAFPGQLAVATVDHGLRPGSAAEAAMVAAWCTDHGIAHATLAIGSARGPSDNLHDWARRQRYRLLARWAIDVGAPFLATAHHADDQAETFLMRAARGSGVAGLAGIRPRRSLDLVDRRRSDHDPSANPAMLALIRPLLGWRSAELRAIARACGVPFVDDPSNADARFDRTQFRALLQASPLLDAAPLARAAAHLAEADAALQAMEAWLLSTRRQLPAGVADADGQLWLDMADLPREMRRRLTRAAIAEVRMVRAIERPTFTDAVNIEPLLDSLEAGKAATQGGILVKPVGRVWRFAEAPPRRSH
ncbi:MAG: tRNA lysidine(34) synthetase TilS [Sphingomonas sp. 28-66-16]|nr:MAG: tRNA lysidine(34) synthetase TilS [Sphingomonas sp. 28-66-16]